MTIQNSERKHRISRMLLAATAYVLLAVLLTQPAKAQTINPGIIDPTNTYAGKTYAEWAAAWWQHFMSLSATITPYHRSPPYPDAPLSTGQSGPVWFMLGTLPSGRNLHLYQYNSWRRWFVCADDRELGGQYRMPVAYSILNIATSSDGKIGRRWRKRHVLHD